MAKGTTDTVQNALNFSMNQQVNTILEEEDLLTEGEITEKERTVRNLMYKAEINLAVLNQ